MRQIAHDPAAFEAFYREHVETVQRFVARRVSDPHLVADLTAEVFLAAIDAAPSFDAGARARELYAALDALPAGERAVFELTALDELTPHQAAAALGIRPVTARVRLHRARAALRAELFETVAVEA